MAWMRPHVWADLADNIVTVTAGWSEAYGMFLEGEADLVLSYTTSPAYHLIAEGDASKKFCNVFDEGHYMQIEVAGKLVSYGSECPWRTSFLQFHGLRRFSRASSQPQIGCSQPSRLPRACRTASRKP